MYTDLQLYIDGEWLNGSGRKSEDVINPATGKALATLPHASNADLDRALDAARKGFAVWRATSAYDRAKVMRKAADLLRERAEAVAKVMVQEQGKPFPEARAEVLGTADIVEWFAEEGRRAYGRIVPGRGKNTRQLVVQEPVGVVAAFTPWNFPTLTPARKIAGALAAGCSIIIKASEETPGSCVELVRCFVDAGLPKGVLNLVFGVPAQVSEYLLASNIIRKISFTGSVPVGKHLAALAARGMKRATMELGGHSPVVVFGDADPEKSADTIAAFKYRNAGQVCISPTRFYVQEGVYDRFLKRFTEFAKNIKLGDGLEKVGQRGGGDFREIGIADSDGLGVVQIRRQLIEKNERRLTLEQIDPRGATRRFERLVIVLERIELSHLSRDLAPQAMRDIGLAPGECDDSHVRQILPCRQPGEHFRAKFRVLRQHPERDEIVRLAAAHRLREFEQRLLGFALHPSKCLDEQRLHPVSDPSLIKKLRPVDFALNQVREIQHCVAFRRVENAAPRCAKLFEGLHSRMRSLPERMR